VPNGPYRRSELISKSIPIFSAKGFRGTSMNDLAAATGLSKSSLYHYFDSKEDILVEIYDDVLRHNVEAAQRVRDSELPTELKLRQLFLERVEYVCRNRRILQVFFEEEAELPRRLLSRVFETRTAYVDLIEGLINKGVEEGVFKITTSPTIVVNTLLGATNWIYKWYSPRGPRSPQQLGEDITDLLLRSITVPSADRVGL
jgi:TetR/AcrR family transcriptional regulator, cholesterol catabolism regulator